MLKAKVQWPVFQAFTVTYYLSILTVFLQALGSDKKKIINVLLWVIGWVESLYRSIVYVVL